MRVAVIIPNLNYGRFLGRALDSANAQTQRPDRVIVVDGKSSDDSFNVAQVHGAGAWIETEPLGMANARNIGIRHAPSAEFILPLDADDWIEPTFIERCLDCFEHSGRVKAFPPVGVVGTNLVWPDGRVQKPQPPFTNERFLGSNLLFTCSMFRRECWEEVGGYNEDRKIYEDWAFWSAIVARKWQIWTVDAPLFHYCPHGESSSSKMAHEDALYRANTIKAIQGFIGARTVD